MTCDDKSDTWWYYEVIFPNISYKMQRDDKEQWLHYNCYWYFDAKINGYYSADNIFK